MFTMSMFLLKLIMAVITQQVFRAGRRTLLCGL
jgi:hypothetical protein